MTRGPACTRRAVLRASLAWLAAKAGRAWGAAASRAHPVLDPVAFTLHGFTPAAAFQRRYRMDATILLLGAPIFTRTAAGGGYASVEKSAEIGTELDGDRAATALGLQFAAGSDPARAHGLNRFGILQEAVVTRGAGSATELSFAGLMTRAREESFEQGRRALASAAQAAEGVVARGRMSPSAIETWIDAVDLSPDCNWSNLNKTLSDARRREPQMSPRVSPPGSATTFLDAMRGAALCPDAVIRRQFLHAGKLYWLETRRQPQRASQAGWELEGAIRGLDGARRAEFRTAYAAGDGSGIPIRIEYRPRSFLRLTFEAEAVSQPAIPSMFRSVLPEESA